MHLKMVSEVPPGWLRVIPMAFHWNRRREIVFVKFGHMIKQPLFCRAKRNVSVIHVVHGGVRADHVVTCCGQNAVAQLHLLHNPRWILEIIMPKVMQPRFPLICWQWDCGDGSMATTNQHEGQQLLAWITHFSLPRNSYTSICTCM